MRRGKLIVFEGADGSGKTTQSKLLVNFFQKKKIGVKYISFPRYEQSLWGAMVKRYLLGEFGKLEAVDPYLASVLYAGDRMSASAQIDGWLDSGKIVVCNRYVGSNIAHMGAKFKVQPFDFTSTSLSVNAQGESSKFKFIEWLEKLEYEENKIPKEDLVVLLQLPPAVSRNLMKQRKLDIHEKDQKYQQEVYRVYDYIATNKKNWVKVACTSGGKILKPEQIHKKVLEVLRERSITRE